MADYAVWSEQRTPLSEGVHAESLQVGIFHGAYPVRHQFLVCFGERRRNKKSEADRLSTRRCFP